jgi:putative FmdB family regulatory protein
MPLYVFECTNCRERFESLCSTPAKGASLAEEPCTSCGGRVRRVISRFSVGVRAAVGPGRSAYPSTWEAVRGGDPEVLGYWRRRIERETREEARDPELVARRAAVAAESAAVQAHANPAQSTERRGHGHETHSWDSVPLVRPASGS